MGRAILGVCLAKLLILATSAAAQTGQGLDPSETRAMSDTLQYALENQASSQAAEWVNPDAGRSGAVIPIRTFRNEQGLPCREFITAIVIGVREQQGYGTACRQPDGTWRIVQRDTAGPTATPASVYLERPPARYYYYPRDLYGSPRIYFSFSYIYRNGHKYLGISYMDGPVFRHRHPVWGRFWMPPPAWQDDRYRRHFDDRGKPRGKSRGKP